MPKIKTNLELAAHLVQAYMDSDNGAKPNEDVQYIQSMKESLSEKDQTRLNNGQRRPMNLQSMNLRYKKLDDELKATADYIKAGNVDPKELYKKQQSISNVIAGLRSDHRDVREALEDPEHRDHATYKEIFDGYDNKKLDDMEPANAQNVLRMTGETKSAYKWIESVYKKMDDPSSVSEENVSLILAARQLGNAVYDHPENIKNTRISEAELRNHAQKLRRSPEFQEYYKTVKDLNFKKTVTHGHGGYLEKTFEDFLVTSGAKGPLEFDLNGRYQRVLDVKSKDISQFYDYKSYADYFEKNKGSVVTSKEVHAARMAAADALHREDPNAPFNKKALDAKAREFMKDPAFKLVTAMPGKMDMIVNGDAPGFAASVKEVNDACKSMLDENGKLICSGHPEISLDRLKNRAEENSDLKDVVESVEKLQQGKKGPKDVIKTVGTIMAYQEKHMKDNMGDMGRDMNDTLRLLHELTNGTPLNSVVQTQIDRTNSARNVHEGRGYPVTRELIAKEGIDKETELDKQVGLWDELDKGMDLGHVNGPIA